jgi:hypothetical protein
MSVQVKFRVTSERPCVVNVLGEFQAGETKEFSGDDLQLFQGMYGYPLARANFASWVTMECVVTEENDKAEEA